ncbi:hypothetical protein, partial [Moorena sp. SIO3B2]|uniref:hypothetical protein n=1 Tax=Moorena sp. SIO3B2 TaxID=2607827 RepID=UPI0013C62F98
MPVLPRCQFYQDASSTKMPILQVRPVANLIIRCGKRMKLARCQFYKTLTIIPLLSNPKKSVHFND